MLLIGAVVLMLTFIELVKAINNVIYNPALSITLLLGYAR
ncbi:hypothetical protein XBI1_3020013 [Xenorhabdus bovienii str. Intermedium]|uniref:Uncharacterized protein n=1 Tax=Xenorhabdus bovienii str. Intermedium TaxID=1379677 RepID=A0A077QLY0_XENBV|nr:hypothetical protein XBI1_3020013 [Xenorhabdus bovienii str. Intermedium]